MSSESTGADGPAPQRRPAPASPGARPGKPKARITRSRLAKPLLTSMGTITMLAASSFVILAVSSTGSAKPWDWTRADPSAAVTRYQLCGKQGLGAIGCMLSAGFRPASAATPGAAHRAAEPLFSVATVEDQASGTSQAAKSGSARGSSTRSGRTGAPAVGSEHVVKLPANATTAQVFAACQAAMKTAVPQGAAAATEVEVECEDDLATRCPAVRTPQVQGTAAIQEMEAECEVPAQAGSTTGHDD